MTNDNLNSNSRYSISLFFPCYNEEENIEQMTAKSLSILESVADDYEIIIVNDGSSDKTGEIADRLAKENPNIKAVHHKTNFGYGAALQSGFHAATKEMVFYTDGDGQFDLSEMPALLEYIGEYDIVSCYRLDRKEGLIRKLNAFCWTKLVCFLFKMKIRDIDCAFKLFKREIFDNIEMKSTGALIDTEILARAISKGYKIKQVGVHHYPRTAGQQTGAKITVVLRAFVELFKLRKHIVQDG